MNVTRPHPRSSTGTCAKHTGRGTNHRRIPRKLMRTDRGATRRRLRTRSSRSPLSWAGKLPSHRGRSWQTGRRLLGQASPSTRSPSLTGRHWSSDVPPPPGRAHSLLCARKSPACSRRDTLRSMLRKSFAVDRTPQVGKRVADRFQGAVRAILTGRNPQNPFSQCLG